MRILLISPLPPPSGGIATWTKNYIDSSYAKENKIYLVNTAVRNNRIKEYKKIVLKEELKRTLDIFLKIKKNVSKIDIAHINTSCGSLGIIRDYLFVKYLKFKKIKVVVHYHCNISDMVSKKYQKIFLKKILKNSDIDLVLNKFSEEYIKKNYQKEVRLIPNFMLQKDFQKLSKLKCIKKDIKKILYTGHITEAKGCKEILEVAKEIPELNFVLAGKVNDEYFKNYTLKNVVFLGEISSQEVKKQLKDADIFLFLSHTEGFTMSLLEAMSAGLPIIATDVGANRDMIEDNGGVIVDIGDVKKVSQEIIKLKSDLILRQKMSVFNIEKVRENYLQEKILEEIFKIYKEILNDKKL